MTVDEVRVAPSRRSAVRLVIAVGLVAMCWIVGNPRSAGPDEPSHMIAAAGFVRLQGSGDPNDGLTRLMDVPQMVGAPDPVCWALVPTATPSCTDDVELTDDVVVHATTSYNYPIWGLVLPGLASFVPWPEGFAYLARILSAAVPVVLVGLSLAALRSAGRIRAAAGLLGVTPIAWFTFGTVNPSALAIAGGLALITGLLLLERPRADTLAAAGWVALVLARRDGPLWATYIVVAVCLLLAVKPSDLWHGLRPAVRALAIATVILSVVPVVWRGEFGFDLLLVLAPLMLGVVEGYWIAWDRTVDRGQRGWLVALALMAGVVGLAVVVARRPGGYDAEVVRLVVANTGDHLTQVVGLLGWLNAPVPTTGVLLYWAAFGALIGVALLVHSRSALVAGAVICVAIVTAWMLELGQGSNYGDYWQGRYTMPLAIGLPLIAVWSVRDARIDALTAPIAGASWLICNLAFFAAQRRWAVGNDGTWYFWRWGTWDAPVHPSAMVCAHAAATAWLVLEVMGPAPLRRRSEIAR